MALSSGIVTAILLLGVSTVLVSTSLLNTDWLTGSHGNHTLTVGLWRTCLDAECMSNFADDAIVMRMLGSWLRVSQACSVMGALLALVSLVLMSCCFMYGKFTCLPWLALTQFLGMILYGLAVLVFLMESYSRHWLRSGSPYVLHIGLSQYIALVGVFFGLLSAALFMGVFRHEAARLNAKPEYTRLN